MTKVFSIITPIKNGISYFQDCIESILSQKGDFCIQYIIIDGISEDGSLELAQSFKNRIANNELPIFCNGIDIQVVSQKDESMYEALANGFRLCSGDLIAYLNSDDMYLPGAFNKVKYCFDNYPIDWLMGMIRTVNSRLELIHELLPHSYDKRLIDHGYYNGTWLPFIQQENVFFTKKCLDLIDYSIFEKNKLAGDYFLWSIFSKSYDLWIASESFAQARMHDNRLSSNKTAYYEEFYGLSKSKTLKSYFKALKWLFVQHLIPSNLKTGLMKNVIFLPQNI